MSFLIFAQLFFSIGLKMLTQTLSFISKFIVLINLDTSDIYFRFPFLLSLIFHSIMYLVDLFVFHITALLNSMLPLFSKQSPFRLIVIFSQNLFSES